MLFGFGALPLLAFANVREDPSLSNKIGSTLLISFGLVIGYICWLIKGHRYEFEDGVVYSIGRKVLWSVNLSEVQRIKEWKSGNLVMWIMCTPKGERGLVLSKTLRNELFKPYLKE